MLNSVAPEPLVPASSSVIDVGSGAGLPGIPLAILRPDLKVTLLESLLRRVSFLELAVAELELGARVTVVRGRAEEHAGRYEVVTCRAVAPLPRLISWCRRLIAPQGRLLALKGASAADELAEAAAAVGRARLKGTVHEVPVPGTADSTWVIELTHA